MVNSALSNSTGNIAAAGTTTQGTRIAIRFGAIAAGSSPRVPNYVLLTSAGITTGIMALVSDADSSGAGGTVPSSATFSLTANTKLTDLDNGIAVYEVLYSNPSAIESAIVVLLVSPTKRIWELSVHSWEVGVPLTATVGFAPFYAPTSAAAASAPWSAKSSSPPTSPASAHLLPTRFHVSSNITQGPFTVFEFSKCVLRPAVPMGGRRRATFTTSIVVANASRS